jgi:hypothetical protein
MYIWDERLTRKVYVESGLRLGWNMRSNPRVYRYLSRGW